MNAPAQDRVSTLDVPVFVDGSGRRRRLLAVVGTSIAVVLLVALTLLGASLSGASPLRVPGFPDLAKPNNGPGTEGTVPVTGRPLTQNTAPTNPTPGLTLTPGPTGTRDPASASGSTVCSSPTRPGNFPTRTPSLAQAYQVALLRCLRFGDRLSTVECSRRDAVGDGGADGALNQPSGEAAV